MTTPCRDARLVRPLSNDLNAVTFDGDGYDTSALAGEIRRWIITII